jgi:aryl-alcohol dehydrogenase-like predicted oxidoreductase
VRQEKSRFLTGRFDGRSKFDASDFRNILPWFTPETLKTFQELVRLVRTLAERKNATPPQVALVLYKDSSGFIVGRPKLMPININGHTCPRKIFNEIGNLL